MNSNSRNASKNLSRLKWSFNSPRSDWSLKIHISNEMHSLWFWISCSRFIETLVSFTEFWSVYPLPHSLGRAIWCRFPSLWIKIQGFLNLLRSTWLPYSHIHLCASLQWFYSNCQGIQNEWWENSNQIHHHREDVLNWWCQLPRRLDPCSLHSPCQWIESVAEDLLRQGLFLMKIYSLNHFDRQDLWNKQLLIWFYLLMI